MHKNWRSQEVAQSFLQGFFLPQIYRAFLIIIFLSHVLGKYYSQMLEVLSSYASVRKKTSQTHTQRQQQNYSQNKVIT